MFGYVCANLNDLTEEEKARYGSHYCGLCLSLKKRWGTSSRLGLTYDMTFLSMLLGSLYEPEETVGSTRCPLHPTKPRAFAQTKFSDYAADMSILLAYANCRDDWKDERRLSSGLFAKTLEGKARLVGKLHPRQTEVLLKETDRLAIFESTQCKDIDKVAACSGAIIGEIFAFQNDFWEEELRAFGMQLGKFIYVMDAACDREKDRETGSYNPLLLLGWDDAAIEHALELLIANVAESFEKLPLERDLHLMKNILYAGVWQCFNKIYHDEKDTTHRRCIARG